MAKSSGSSWRRRTARTLAGTALLLASSACSSTAARESDAARADRDAARALDDAPVRLAGHGQRMALRAAKVLTVSDTGPGFIDHAVVLVKDGRIEWVGPASELSIPADYVLHDVGSSWVMPGMIDLHTHVAGSPFANDINDMVLQTNEGLRASTAVIPGAELLRREVAAGITTVLFIPGSGTNIGGQGVLLKTGLPGFEAMRVRDPGSLKIAQGDNPTRWGYGMGRSMMNYHIRTQVRKGVAYARAWHAHEHEQAPKPDFDPQFEVFRALFEQDTQISTHTQMY